MGKFCVSIYSTVLVFTSISAVIIGAREPELRLVNVIFRHGDRTQSASAEAYPEDPYNNATFYPVGRGGLTNQGKQREYQLGQVLAERYKKFLGPIYTPGMLEARSTDYARTKMSLQLVLAALFPPVSIQIWNKQLNWQPIPATYLPSHLDVLLIPEECPQYLEEMTRVLQLTEVHNAIEEFRDFMQNLTEVTGKSIVSPYDMYNLYLGLTAQTFMNLTLPNWTKDIDFPGGRLLDGTLLYYKLFSYSPQLKKLNGGMLVKEITRNMESALNASQDDLERKLYLYSGHETNVAAILQGLDVYKPQVPAFGSAVIVELLELDQEYYVKVLHYLSVPPEVKEMQIPGCSILCPLDKFRDLMRKAIPSENEMVCPKGKDSTEKFEKVVTSQDHQHNDVNH